MQCLRRLGQSFGGTATRRTPMPRWLSIHVENNDPKISSIYVYQLDLPVIGGYKNGKHKPMEVLDSTIVQIKTNKCVEGWGEHAPYGSTYLPAFAKGTRAGIQEIGPALIGKNPCHLLEIDQTMDDNLAGHPYVKAAIDIACWDILGKMAKLSLCSLLGGRFGSSFPIYRTISGADPEKLREDVQRHQEDGYCKFQCKVGGDVNEDIELIKAVSSSLKKGDTMWADGNCGYSTRDALTLVQRVWDLGLKVPFFLEQPCKTYEENLFIRQKSPFPMILDENVDSIEAVMRISRDKAADMVSLKLGKGGMTRALQMRNLCSSLGIIMTIEDVFGWCITNAALSHLAHSTPPQVFNAAPDLANLLDVDSKTLMAHNSPRTANGRMSAPTGYGLGVEPIMEVLGQPVFVIE